MTAFATYTALGVRMKRTFTEAEQPWITALLDDAAAIMRGVMRDSVYPSATSTYTAYPVGGRVNLPFGFITELTSVTRDGDALVDGTDYVRFEDSITALSCDDPIVIVVVHGLATAPADLLALNCALVSGSILTVEAGLGLTAGGLSSVQIDDFRAAFANAGEQSGMALTPANIRYLEDHYGRAGWVVNTR